MKINYTSSQSTVKPDLIDSSSSKKYVYLRKEIIETSADDGVLYDYQEAKLTKEEYEEYLKELSIIDIQQQRADIDYIALMAGVDLEV